MSPAESCICRRFTLTTVLAVAVLCAFGCSSKEPVKAPVLKEKVTFCQGGHVTLLPLEALEKNFFDNEGVEAVINRLGDGKTAMETFLAGDCTFGIMAEPPIAKQAFGRSDFAIIASLASTSDFTRILYRKDRGISSARDLKGKRIGIKKGTTSQIFADLYLKKHGISPKEVSFQYMEQRDMPAALMSGDIDAYSSSHTFLMEGMRTLGDNGGVLSEPGFYKANSYLVAKKSFVATHAETVQRVMKALARADNELAAKPAEAQRLVADVWKVSDSDAEKLLKLETHTLALGQQQLDALMMHASWIISSGAVNTKTPPDFKVLIDTAPLTAAKPAAVTTIH